MAEKQNPKPEASEMVLEHVVVVQVTRRRRQNAGEPAWRLVLVLQS